MSIVIKISDNGKIFFIFFFVIYSQYYIIIIWLGVDVLISQNYFYKSQIIYINIYVLLFILYYFHMYKTIYL